MHIVSHLASFPRLVHFYKICYLFILATSWDQCTCTDIGYLCVSHRLSAIATKAKGITCDCFIPTTRVYLTSRQMTCVCGQSFDTSSDKVDESLERYHNDQVNFLPSVLDYVSLPNKPVVGTLSQ
jgi:hypothetical protein